ncbi:BRO-N domain-containing protein [Roseovarius aquimarinus]|uniref:Bro-N domain-containing protein n=1 Tax=Roseovarius aquimarinus TaxID=1229156 RepID=A0ABW7IB90_9RHOB
MTTSTAMDINTFCALSFDIETHFDGGGTAWFVFSKQLQDLLELPEEFDHHEFFDLEDWNLDLIERDDGTKAEIELVSEAGLYMLILMSEAQATQPFKSWVLEIVAPTLAEDGQYAMSEERSVPAPIGYNLSHQDIWSGDLSETGNAIDLAERFLPALRQTGTTDDGVIRVVSGKPQIDQDAFLLAMSKKVIRMAAAKAKT